MQELAILYSAISLSHTLQVNSGTPYIHKSYPLTTAYTSWGKKKKFTRTLSGTPDIIIMLSRCYNVSPTAWIANLLHIIPFSFLTSERFQVQGKEKLIKKKQAGIWRPRKRLVASVAPPDWWWSLSPVLGSRSSHPCLVYRMEQCEWTSADQRCSLAPGRVWWHVGLANLVVPSWRQS